MILSTYFLKILFLVKVLLPMYYGTLRRTCLNCHDSRKQFRRTALSIYFRQQIIHLREKNIAGPTEKSKTRKRFLVRREGPAFFDEDDVCYRYFIFDTANLNFISFRAKEPSPMRVQSACLLTTAIFDSRINFCMWRSIATSL